MGEVTLTINGRSYGMACDDGQEQRVIDLGHYVDQRLKEISKTGAAGSENHLLVLTALMLSDEVFELRENIAGLSQQADSQAHESESFRQEEAVIAQAIDSLAERIDLIANRIQKA